MLAASTPCKENVRQQMLRVHATNFWWKARCIQGSQAALSAPQTGGTEQAATCLDERQQALRCRHLVQLGEQVGQNLQCSAVLALLVLPAGSQENRMWDFAFRGLCIAFSIHATLCKHTAQCPSAHLPVHVSKAKLAQALLAQLKQVCQAQLAICPGLAPALAARERAVCDESISPKACTSIPALLHFRKHCRKQNYHQVDLGARKL